MSSQQKKVVRDKKLLNSLDDSQQFPADSQQKESAVNVFDEQMARLWRATGSNSDAELARALGITQQSVSSVRTRKQLPLKWVTKISEAYGLSTDWLLFGAGQARQPDEAEDREKGAPPGSFTERLLWLISDKADGKPVAFARHSGIPPSLLYHYVEGGKPAPEHLVGIRDSYGVNLDWLLQGKGDPYLNDMEQGVVHQAEHLYNVPEPDHAGAPGPASKIDELLALAAKILTGRDPEASEALEKTIRRFAHSLELEKRLLSMEERLKDIEKRLLK